ncbi:Type I secretion outer membrane protein, TolC precursor [Rubrivivax sp. A210]|uniref:TolC family outer membrane protein n=1 Tax=Rubrivivax sp. A210 TaxID=2772301 RepID=UPI001917BBEB|nr:TolC family outer membrane protein [Rubrivivax sp. A210]CAD5372234.1 Type I secretion outer membrane protein, TolC precursor [Rubrivivax sp. A210]
MPASLPRRPRLSALLAALTLATLPGLAGAQSLRELYEAARAFDATYLAAKDNARSAEFRAAQSDALARPSAVATGGASTTQTDLPRSSGLRNSDSLSAAINGRYPLINRANGVTIEQARKSLVSAQADLDAAEQDLILRVTQAYFDVLAAQDALATTRANKAATTEQLASAKRNFEVGTATITDTREAQARFDLGTAQELAAENDLLTKRIALDTLVGRNHVEPRPLALPPVLPAVTPANPEEWVTTADQQHPTVRRARVGLEVAVLETAKARAADAPTLDAVASVGGNNARGSAVALSGTSTSASIGVQFNWPLYTGGATQNRIKETLALEDKSRNDLEAARRAVAQGTRVAYFGVQSGLAQVKALEAAESSTKLALEATQLGYKVGVRVNLDVLNAQRDLYSTQRDLARARYDVLVGSLRLRQASGQLAPADIDSVNRLLAP